MRRYIRILFANIEKVSLYIFILGLIYFLILISVNFQIHRHIIVGWLIDLVIFLVVIFLYRTKKEDDFRRYLVIFIIILASFNILKYFYWRTTVSLPDNFYFPDFIPALLLYLAEVYSIIIFFTGAFTSIRPLNRKVIPISQFREEELPTVDVFIPTYNEPIEVLAPTIINAVKMEYPKDKLKVYILDDGGTDEKCNDPNPEKARQARERRKMLQEFAKKVGAYYLTREKNYGAKAGNINEALKKTNGDLVLILDADHIPAKEFLSKTVGWFLKEPKLFLIQTPHAFYNPDPIEKNLGIFERQPQENEMFYKQLQKGMDFWNSSFFCGSAALLRRKYLEEVGGIQGKTITEDAETALSLHAKGLKSAYIPIPMIRGLQPESFGGLVTQRIRWAQGMVQIFLLNNPLKLPLKWYQKINYFSSSFYWFFGFARFMFLIAPFFFVFFGLKIYSASLSDVLALTLPALISSYTISFILYKDVRAFLSSELYEAILSIFILPAIISVFRNPHAPEFKVTPKGERLDRNFVSQLFMPIFIIWILTIVALIVALVKAYLYPDERYAYLVNIAWLLFNFTLLTAGLAAVSEKAERRRFFRIKLDAEVEIPTSKGPLKTKAIDISLGGIAVEVNKEIKEYFEKLKKDTDIEFIITNPAKETKVLKGKYHYMNNRKLVFTFDYNNLEFQNLLSDIIFGRADNWILYEEKRPIDYLVLLKNIPKIPKLVFWREIIKEFIVNVLNFLNFLQIKKWRRVENA